MTLPNFTSLVFSEAPMKSKVEQQKFQSLKGKTENGQRPSTGAHAVPIHYRSSRQMKSRRTLSPRNARSLEQAITLNRDNVSTERGWILIDDGTVCIAEQASGCEAKGIVKLPRGEFNRMIDWYNKEQLLKAKRS